jgi:hypothetical protein
MVSFEIDLIQNAVRGSGPRMDVIGLPILPLSHLAVTAGNGQ